MMSANKLTLIDIDIVLIRIFEYCYLAYLLIIMYGN